MTLVRAPRFVNKIQRVFDVSTLDLIMRCPTLYNYKSRQGWRSRRARMKTNFGSAIHRACQILATQKFLRKSLDEAINLTLEVVLKEFGPQIVELGWKRVRGKEIVNPAYGLDGLLRIVVWKGMEIYETKYTLAALEDGAPALETLFEVPLPHSSTDNTDSPYRLSGRIDSISLLHDELFVEDTKSTDKDLTESWFSMFNPSNQMYGYLWVLRKKLKIPVRGFSINGIQTLDNTARFRRANFYPSDDQLDEWFDSAMEAISRVTQYAKMEEFGSPAPWPQYFSACHSYGGCEFLNVCTIPAHLRGRWLNEDFIQKYHPTFSEEPQDGSA